MMYRKALEYLREWRGRRMRMPLVIRGARQVGKSSLVRLFAEELFTDLLEINLEVDQAGRKDFAAETPAEILQRLELRLNRRIIPGKTLLFLDEIQAAPELFAKLRYFHEQLPDLHIVAAGSLLDFVLEEHSFSMPVGRVEYLHLGPMLFTEFLLACGKRAWVEFLAGWDPSQPFPESLHGELLGALRQYLVVGGMPKAILAYREDHSLREAEIIKGSILATYQDDFAKYGERVNRERLAAVFQALPRLVGQKFMYVNVSRLEAPRELAKALHQLELARVCTRVQHSASRGIPLGAEVKEKTFKVLMLDVGLLLSLCGLRPEDVQELDALVCVNSGALAEQFVGQHLLYREDPCHSPQLHYWVREKASANAELDYVISVGTRIVPIEVKAGATGALRSLHHFVHDRQLDLGVRFNRDLPSIAQAQGRLPTGDHYDYRLLSLPLYMVEQVERLVRGDHWR